MKESMQGYMNFRYNSDKTDFLKKAYGSELPRLLRKCADELLIKAVEQNRIKTKCL